MWKLWRRYRKQCLHAASGRPLTSVDAVGRATGVACSVSGDGAAGGWIPGGQAVEVSWV